MKRITVFVFALLVLVSGCREKQVISVDRLESLSKVNVLYVALAERYKLGPSMSSIERLVRGGAYFSIDLSEAKLSEMKVAKGASVTITLPPPKVEAFPDPARSIEFKAKTDFLVNDKGLNRIREQYDRMDREKIAAAADRPAYHELARVQAEKMLKDMLPEINVNVVWETLAISEVK